MQANPASKRVALIGAPAPDRESRNASLVTFNANTLATMTTLCDFDEVVVNIAGLVQLSQASLDAARKLFAVDAVRDHLQAGGHILVFGDPTRSLFGPPLPMPGGNHHPRLVLASTMGLPVTCTAEAGYRFTISNDPQHEPYAAVLDALTEFKATIALDKAQSSLARSFAVRVPFETARQLGFPSLAAEALATTRAGRAIALHVEVRQRTVEGHETRGAISGTISLFPQPTLSPAILRVVLESVCGVQFETEPAWIGSIRVATEDQLDRETADAQQRIESDRAELRAIQARRVEARSDLEILWLKGVELEEPVFRVLEKLGATVRRPAARANNEEAWLEVTVGGRVCRAVLEVKSTAKDQVGKDGVRQLDEWVSRGRAAGDSYKGILIVNTAVEQAPHRRASPFPPNVTEAAALSGHALLTTWDLHRAVVGAQRGQLELAEFWNALFAASGPLDITSLMKPDVG